MFGGDMVEGGGLQRGHGPRAVVRALQKQHAQKACLRALFEKFPAWFERMDKRSGKKWTLLE